MRNLYKTICWTALVCMITVAGGVLIQVYAGGNINGEKCSYLDHAFIDYAAFGMAVFLIMEGIYRISEHKDAKPTKQFTRSVRIAIGVAIITLHVMQILQK